MEIEVLLSVMNLKKEQLDKMNITSKCTIINQCGKNDIEKYRNFKIYSYNELGTANSRNRGLEHVTGDIILLCDDDMIYDKNYENMVLEEFRNNPKADAIVFNVRNPYRRKKKITKVKRLHIYNSLRYAAYNLAFRREKVQGIKFNTRFVPNANYKSGGDDTLFIVDCMKNKLKIYSSPKNIGMICSNESTWFKGYDEKYFFDRGALFTEINEHFRIFLILQHLIRHREILKDINFFTALKNMLKGSRDYINKYKKGK